MAAVNQDTAAGTQVVTSVVRNVTNPEQLDVVYGNLPIATTEAAGAVRLGSATQQDTAANAVTATAQRTYAVQRNSNNQMMVNVPWTDTDTVTNISMNNVAATTTPPAFFAPTAGGAAGQVLRSGGNAAPTWGNLSIPVGEPGTGGATGNFVTIWVE
ncbi:MAG: hypothetical protein FWE17_01785, partial [Alphaproteobacteria bacterium]|nr:hypothetical protein [Alphaproteobacteria bacterium]MCL2757802.1 hypothetical protein [Alphaproteobacteria bacterium]